ncbi:rod shape-determining protein MreC [Gloeobacter kilaueensis]|uniref:Cell shape-determining protein MreC n=1 Tax=Gloeobacter kilaueensis (strain ATCC BAA-2537 / CCAP 1431/1 / ULC 316 / JS1) TaxID=1183438 RepID=U5QCT8_GLOK1|nr:rod shape-determining protein MreC [Gloeobacter kilaueensis]AGY56663.1 rod shape-determining protein MreC [Gloeobacter kilaueensis JS1]
MVEKLRRWWLRFGLVTLAAVLALGAAWWVRRTDGAMLSDLFALLASPFIYPAPTAGQLRDEQLAQLQARLESLFYENRQLRNLHKIDDRLGSGAVSAQVIGRSADHWWEEVLLNRGSADGIAVGATVVTGNGAAVGQVSQVGAYTSRVLLLSDPGSQVGVMAVRSRMMGILQGHRRDPATVEFFEQPPLKAGELIVTSGLSSRFPSGLPVGRVTAVDRNQAVPKVKIAFVAPLDRLEWVKIYPGVAPVQLTPAPPPPPTLVPAAPAVAPSSTPAATTLPTKSGSDAGAALEIPARPAATTLRGGKLPDQKPAVSEKTPASPAERRPAAPPRRSGTLVPRSAPQPLAPSANNEGSSRNNPPPTAPAGNSAPADTTQSPPEHPDATLPVPPDR